VNKTSIFYQLIYYICKNQFFEWEIKDQSKNKSVYPNEEEEDPKKYDTELQAKYKEEQDRKKELGIEDTEQDKDKNLKNKEVKKIKVKISKLDKKNLLFESKELTQSLVVPLTEIWDLKYENDTYSFFLKSKPENLHMLKSI